MAPTPRPAGWQGGSEDFSIVRTFDGHVATDRYNIDDGELHRNERTGFAAADLSGSYDGVEIEEG